jgi:hypothetical protein
MEQRVVGVKEAQRPRSTRRGIAHPRRRAARARPRRYREAPGDPYPRARGGQGAHEAREGEADAVNLARLGLAQFLQIVCGLHKRRRLDEHRLARIRGAVDDAMHLAALAGAHGEHIASAALRG